MRLDRYAKFRKLGMFEEHLVHGGQWREARKQRAEVSYRDTFHHTFQGTHTGGDHPDVGDHPPPAYLFGSAALSG